MWGLRPPSPPTLTVSLFFLKLRTPAGSLRSLNRDLGNQNILCQKLPFRQGITEVKDTFLARLILQQGSETEKMEYTVG